MRQWRQTRHSPKNIRRFCATRLPLLFRLVRVLFNLDFEIRIVFLAQFAQCLHKVFLTSAPPFLSLMTSASSSFHSERFTGDSLGRHRHVDEPWRSSGTSESGGTYAKLLKDGAARRYRRTYQ